MRVIVRKGCASVVKKEAFVSDRMSYLMLSNRWCDVIALNVDAATDGKCASMKESLHIEVQHAFDQFPKYQKQCCYGTSVQSWGGNIFSN
jgi:hypothetical protein